MVNCETRVQANPIFTFIAMKFGKWMYLSGCAHVT